MHGGGTSFSLALKELNKNLNLDPSSLKYIVFLSDGENCDYEI